MTYQKNLYFRSLIFALAAVAIFAVGKTSIAATPSLPHETTTEIAQEPETAVGAEVADTIEAASSESEEVDPGLLGTLGINWKLFLAQLVNFAIVLFVLWKWVFTPVAKGLEARTKKIEQSLNDAESITKEKEEFTVWKNKQMSVARAEAADIVIAAKKEAEGVKTEILEKTKLEQEKLAAQAKANLIAEQAKALAEAKTEIAGLVVAATQAIIKQKLDPTKDKELIKQALKQTI